MVELVHLHKGLVTLIDSSIAFAGHELPSRTRGADKKRPLYLAFLCCVVKTTFKKKVQTVFALLEPHSFVVLFFVGII